MNVSRADVYQSRLVDMLQELIRKYGIDPAYLHLEITESAYAENPGQIISTVEELRKLGFIIEMDDFGSGYSSLNMLSQMTLDILKLDMKFIQNEMAKPVEQSILNDIISMAHRLHLNVVAEGVETRDQTNRLRAVGCDYVQGYYFAKPMPAADFERLLQAQHPKTECPAKKARRNEPGVRNLLVADEDAGYRKRVRQTFEGQYRVLEASDRDGALACIRSCEDGGVSAVILSMTLPEDGAAAVLSVLRQEPAFWKLPVLATIPSGEKMEELPLAMETDDFLCKCHPMFDLQRRVQRLMDIAAAREREHALKDEANRDPLTGLFNRRGLQTAMDSLRMEDLPLAVCLFDLDNLKEINDTHGHETGDRMIRAFANLLRSQTRMEDIQCRYGGDEFMVVLKHLNDVKTVMKKGTDICRAFHDSIQNETFPVSCSAGIALCESAERPSAELIDHADQALYRAKRENKGGCCLWESEE